MSSAFFIACAQRATQTSPPAANNGQEVSTPPPARGGSFSPRRLAFSDALVQRLRVPAGFAVNVFARDVTDARVMVVAPDGTVYVSQPDLGQVTLLRDANDDGRAETRRVAVSGLPTVHGMALRGQQLFLAVPTRVYVADLRANGTAGTPRVIAENLPPGRQHPNRTLGFGPDGLLYLSVGSSCNDCVESNPEHATMLRMRADGSERRVFARGLRNTIGFDWHPVTGELWGMDQGSDNRGPNDPPEELNHLINGRHYGWPWCYGAREVDTRTPGSPPNRSKAQFCPTTEPAVLGYQAHSSPIQFRFYTGAQFPAVYRHDAFITFHGSWNRNPAVGYKVVRVRFNPTGRPTEFEDFLTGFLTNDGAAQFGRPAGLAQLPNGALLVGDDSNGVIYRVTYR